MAVTGAHADEASFLRSLQGKFSGKGTVRIRTSSPVMSISCTFTSDATASSLSLDGTCRALLIMTREIRADLKISGTRYSGTYIGGDMTAQISGKRRGDTVDFSMTWGRPINPQGDIRAKMTIVNSSSVIPDLRDDRLMELDGRRIA